MKKNDGFKSSQLRTTSIAVAAALFMSACASTPEIPPPTELIAVSRAAITTASSAGATEFAPVQLKSAMDKMDSAERAMGAKDYGLARKLAEEAQVEARFASAATQTGKAEKAASALHESDHVLKKELDRNATQ
jgi:hypothetical protein